MPAPSLLIKRTFGDCHDGIASVDLSVPVGWTGPIGPACCSELLSITEISWEPEYGIHGRMKIVLESDSCSAPTLRCSEACISSPVVSRAYLSPDGMTEGTNVEINIAAGILYIEAEEGDTLEDGQCLPFSLSISLSGSVSISYGKLTKVDSNNPTLGGIGHGCGVWSDGNLIYLAVTDAETGGQTGLCTYSIDETGQLTFLNSHYPGFAVADVFGHNDKIYIANLSKGIGSYTVDASGVLSYHGGHDAGGFYEKIWCDANWVYAVNFSGILVYQADGVNLILKDSHLPAGASSYGVWGDGHFLYVAHGDAGLYVYTVNSTGNLTLVDSDSQGGTYFGVWGDGSYIYVASSNGLVVYTANASGNLSFVKSRAVEGGNIARAVWCDETGLIFLAVTGENWLSLPEDTGLYTFFVDDHQNIILCDKDNDVNGYAVWGDENFVYLGDYDAGIVVYSVERTRTVVVSEDPPEEDPPEEDPPSYETAVNTEYARLMAAGMMGKGAIRALDARVKAPFVDAKWNIASQEWGSHAYVTQTGKIWLVHTFPNGITIAEWAGSTSVTQQVAIMKQWMNLHMPEGFV